MTIKLLKILDKITPGASNSLRWEIVLAALTFPASILVNRELGATDRGLFSLMALIPSTVTTLATCQWERIVKGLITSHQVSPREALYRTFFYVFRLSLIFIPIGIIACLAYGQISISNRIPGALFMLGFPVVMLSNTLSSIYLASGNIGSQYAIKLAYQISYIVLVALLGILGWLSPSTLLLIYFLIALSSMIIGLSKIPSLEGETFGQRPSLKPLFQSFLPYTLESFTSNIDIWAMSFFGSLTGLGNYVAISGLMQPVGLISNALASGSTARLNWENPEVVQSYLYKSTFVMGIMFSGLAVGGVVAGPWLINLTLGRSFSDGSWMIPWIAAITVGRAIALQFHTSLQLSGHIKSYLFIQTLDSIVRSGMVLGLGLFLKEFGILAGLTISLVLKCTVCYFYTARERL